MSIANSIKRGLPSFSPTAKYNRGDRFVYEGNVCEVTDVMDGEAIGLRVYDKERRTRYSAFAKEFLQNVNLDYNKSIYADDVSEWTAYPSSNRKRLVCEYCDCISGKDHGTCEHCGAVLTEPKSADLDEVMKRWW